MSTSKTVTLTFDSMAEMLAYIDTKPVLTKGESNLDSEYFTHSKNLAHAISLVEGWREGEEQVARMSAPIVDLISSKIERNDIVYDVEGMGIDVAKYVEGEPECWQSYVATHVEGQGQRILRLVVNGSTSAGISTDEMIKRGSFITATVDCLERAGFNVEVWYVMGCLGYSKIHTDIHVKIKESNQPIDLARLAFALGHPSMLRRLLFAVIERTPDSHVEANNGYGHPANNPMEKMADVAFPKHYLGEVFPTSRLIDILQKQGVILTGEVNA